MILINGKTSDKLMEDDLFELIDNPDYSCPEGYFYEYVIHVNILLQCLIIVYYPSYEWNQICLQLEQLFFTIFGDTV